MEITKENINKIDELYREQSKISKKQEKKFSEAEKGSKDRTIERNDKDGNPQEIREYDAWEEAKRLGWESEAGKALRERYPELYELDQKAKEKKNEIYEYCQKEMDVDPFNLSYWEIIKTAKGVMEAVLEDNKNFKDKIKQK